MHCLVCRKKKTVKVGAIFCAYGFIQEIFYISNYFVYSYELLSADHKATVCDNVFCGFCIFRVIFVVLGWREISGGDILPSKQVWETYVHASYNTVYARLAFLFHFSFSFLI